MTAIRKQYDYYKITYKNGKVSGLPIFMVRQAEAYERMIPNWDKDMFTKLGMEMDKYFKLMKRIAIAYNNAADVAAQDELKQKFLAMYDHITDQGDSISETKRLCRFFSILASSYRFSDVMPSFNKASVSTYVYVFPSIFPE